MAQLGEILRAAREEQRLTLDEVATATHIRRHLIEALEENNFDAFPSPVITRGLIRNYAKFLKIDPIEALTLYDGKGRVPVKGQRLTEKGIEFMNLSMTPRSYINWELIIGIAAGFLVVAGLWYMAYGTIIQPGVITATPTRTPRAEGITEESALILPTSTPLPTNTPTPLPPTSTPTPIIYSGVTVELVLKQSSWVQILADDEKVFEGILQPGDNQSWTGERRVAIRAGNGGGVEVIVNGVNRGLMGNQGQVVDQIWEKVDSPSELPAEPSPTISPFPTFSEPPLAGTPTPQQDSELESLPIEDAALGATPEG